MERWRHANRTRRQTMWQTKGIREHTTLNVSDAAAARQNVFLNKTDSDICPLLVHARPKFLYLPNRDRLNG